MLKNSIENLKDHILPDKLKIKILKGILNKDELGKPYIEYITDITHKTNNWRINKKFNQFANLHKTLKAQFTDIKFPDSSSLFSKLTDITTNFHENKIKSLETYLKDISDIGVINKSKVFRKFFDFEDYVENEPESLVQIISNVEATPRAANTSINNEVIYI